MIMKVTTTRVWGVGEVEVEEHDYVWPNHTAAEGRAHWRRLGWPPSMTRTREVTVHGTSWTEHTHRQFTDEPEHDEPA